MPLATAAASAPLNDAEFYWTCRVHRCATRGMNGLNVDGEPGRARTQWSRGVIQPRNATSRSRPASSYRFVNHGAQAPMAAPTAPPPAENPPPPAPPALLLPYNAPTPASASRQDFGPLQSQARASDAPRTNEVVQKKKKPKKKYPLLPLWDMLPGEDDQLDDADAVATAPSVHIEGEARDTLDLLSD